MIDERISAAVRAAAARLAEHARVELPGGIAVEVLAQGVRLSGRGLIRRHADDPRLRGLASIVGKVRR